MVYINAICHPGLAELPQAQASQRAYWGTAGRGSAHIEGRTSRDALDHLYWINDLDDNEERRGIFKINNNSITKNECHLANYMLPHQSDFSKKTTVIYSVWGTQASQGRRGFVPWGLPGPTPGAAALSLENEGDCRMGGGSALGIETDPWYAFNTSISPALSSMVFFLPLMSPSRTCYAPVARITLR